jgi:hypothetical protein
MGDDTRGRDLRVLGLTWAAGCVDAIGYLGLGHVFTANMAGNTVRLGMAIGQAQVLAVLRTLVALGGFAGGVALVSGLLHACRPALVMALPFLAIAAVVAGAARRAPARLAVVAAALLLAGCATEVPLAPPARSVPDLRGTWTGTWGGTPVTLVVLSQEEAYESGTVAVGPWTLAGYPLPGVSGVMTFSIDGEATTVNVRGRVGDRDGRLTLVLGPLTARGEQIVLARVGQDRLRGTGVSRATWEPQGPIELVRRPRD